MRNPLRRITMLVGALILAFTLLASDTLAQPAEAHNRRSPTVSAQPRKTIVRTYRRRNIRRNPRRVRRTVRSVPRPVVPVTGDVWAHLRQCESGGRYDINTGNGYYGAYQFKLSTWRGLGYPGYPHQATPQMQDEAAQKLQARSGWGQWPACTRRLGLR